MKMLDSELPNPTIAFLPQPVSTLARQGEVFTQRVLTTLNAWVGSDRTKCVVSELGNETFILGEKAMDWAMVVIVRNDYDRYGWGVDVCSVACAPPDGLMEHFKPLAHIDRLTPLMQVRLHAIDPAMFSLVAENFVGAPWYAPTCEPPASNRYDLFHLMNDVDRNAHRWASSKARNSFKTLLDDARKRPQLVEREGDDLLVVSRRYLQQMAEPTSAQGMSRRYRAMALSESDMPGLAPRALAPLDDLPVLGAA